MIYNYQKENLFLHRGNDTKHAIIDTMFLSLKMGENEIYLIFKMMKKTGLILIFACIFMILI